MMKLKTDELDSNSFLFMARNLHSTEFLRLLNCRNNHVLDTYSRTEAFKIIVESRFNCSESETMLLELLKYDVDPSVKIIRYNNVIVWAAERGLVDLFKVLLNDPRIDVNAQDEYGDLAIHKAVLEGHLPILKLILDDGRIDPNVVGYASRNVIHCAATRNQHSILKYLRANTNVDPALADINGDHAIHSAAYCNAEESIEILLDDPDVDLLARDSTGWTIVQLLVAYEKWDLVKRVGGDVFHSWA
jgi:ankyrin repeat protein